MTQNENVEFELFVIYHPRYNEISGTEVKPEKKYRKIVTLEINFEMICELIKGTLTMKLPEDEITFLASSNLNTWVSEAEKSHSFTMTRLVVYPRLWEKWEPIIRKNGWVEL
jgi:hypothetical protein